jgi:hypothetical protein
MILSLWPLGKSIWQRHNHEIHGQTIHENKSKAEKKLEKQARYLYDT